MPYPPNEKVPNFVVFNGGTQGARVTAGQYALDWIRSLGGDVTLSNNNTTMTVVMPKTPDDTPAQMHPELQAMLTVYRESVIAAVQGVAYPPLPNPASCPARIDPLNF